MKKPGPVGTSCLTCRRRRKKCGRQRPTCERCVEGEFECLGYDGPSEHTTAPNLREPIHLRVLPPDLRGFTPSQPTPIPPVDAASSDAPTPSMIDYLPVLYPESDGNGYLLASASADGSNEFSTSHLENDNTSASASDGDSLAHRDSQPQTLSASVASNYGNALVSPAASVSCASWKPRVRSGGSLQATAALSDPRYSPSNQISSHMFSLPRGLSPVPTHAKKMVDFVVTQYDRLFSFCYFDRIPEGAAKFLASIIQRAFNSSTTRCIMFLGAKIIDSTLDGTLPKKYSHYNQWIERFEHDLWTRTRNLAYDEDQTHLVDTLEVRFLF
ncbi:hypothetical protein BDV93DRAFT_365286 [Ceratobasidium sp. AG-I]|nr:hypothetical protein BDV93DRAFT_365286 [Ceratobasidium sp. AG-I]